ncbi:hypothetical protein Hanom_Chr05g00431141 [Helianthus anomalus]
MSHPTKENDYSTLFRTYIISKHKTTLKEHPPKEILDYDMHTSLLLENCFFTSLYTFPVFKEFKKKLV